MAEKPEKIQLAQQIAGLLDKVNNTSLKKHPATTSLTQVGHLSQAADWTSLSPSSCALRPSHIKSSHPAQQAGNRRFGNGFS